MRNIVYLCILFISCNTVLAASDFETKFNSDSSEISLNINFNLEQVLLDDAKREAKGEPLRMAKLYALPLDMDSVGKHDIAQDGSQSWIFSINIPQSYGVIAFFEEFYIPHGAQVYVYSEDENSRTSVYDYTRNPKGGRYTLEVELGNKLIIEYIAPNTVKEKPRFKLQDLAFKYKNLNEAYYTDENHLRSLNVYDNSCTPNINCEEGADWQLQKKGVVRLRTRMGRYLLHCSGSLINNTNEDRAPLILTAQHCLYTSDDEALDLEMTEFFFDYEYPACQDSPKNLLEHKVLTGAEILVMAPLQNGSDGALLRLHENIPEDWDAYFNGWDISNRNGIHTAGAVIQHPLGNVKKIAIYNLPLMTTTWIYSDKIGAPNAHWDVQYSKGVTQKGSSGSPIFNQEKLIVGTLTGGNTNCIKIPNGKIQSDQFGKMSYHWNQSRNKNEHMQKYLDPHNKLKNGKLKGFPIEDNGVIIPEERPDISVLHSESEIYLISKAEMSQLRIVNLQGVVTYSISNMKTKEFVLPSDAMRRGLYILEVRTIDGKRHKMKFIR